LILIPDSQMDAMGAQAFDEMKSREKVNRNGVQNNYVKCIADSITTSMNDSQSWEVVVFDEPSPNAFALPGGKIGVHTGMLKVATNADQLAAVIGHEVGHVIARHGNERVSEQFATQGGLALILGTMQDKGPKYDLIMAGLGLGMQFGVLLPHSRTQESEADLIGLDLMSKAGFDPRQSVQLWKNMDRASSGGSMPEFLSTHPSHGSRIDNLNSHMGEAMKLFSASSRRPNCQSK
jgi:predicted Zn-dependent protease